MTASRGAGAAAEAAEADKDEAEVGAPLAPAPAALAITMRSASSPASPTNRIQHGFGATIGGITAALRVNNRNAKNRVSRQILSHCFRRAKQNAFLILDPGQYCVCEREDIGWAMIWPLASEPTCLTHGIALSAAVAAAADVAERAR